MLQIFNYNAGAGDCIRMRYNGHNIIIDSGVTRFGTRFKTICDEIKSSGEVIDALILTHVDADHIGGILYCLRLFRDIPIREVWMNHGNTCIGNVDLSTRQNDEVYSLLIKREIPVFPAVAGTEHKIGGATFRILSPDNKSLNEFFRKRLSVPLSAKSDYGYSIDELKEKPILAKDSSQNNRVSVVFEFIYDGMIMLFTGDAWSETICSVGAPAYDLIKLPHHGSVRNISEEWNSIKCSNYMICTDGVNHPDKQTIAKLVKWNGDIKIYGSSPWWRKMLTEEDAKYKEYFVEGEMSSW